MECIVKMPINNEVDYDFIAFSYNGLHSYEDFGIYRTPNGNRYEVYNSSQIQDVTAEIPGGDGAYFLGSKLGVRNLSINFVFEKLSEEKLLSLKRWLTHKDLAPLWFAEEPYKVYMVKPTGTVMVKAVVFDNAVEEQGETLVKRVYSGEGSVTFTAYCPYAKTPDAIHSAQGNFIGRGTAIESYKDFNNYQSIYHSSRLKDSTGSCRGENPGDLPSNFIFTYKVNSDAGLRIKLNDSVIDINKNIEGSEVIWDSQTGLISAKTEETSITLAYSGNGCIKIPPRDNGEYSELLIQLYNSTNEKWENHLRCSGGQWFWWNEAITSTDKWTAAIPLTIEIPQLNYHYWYY